MRVRDWWDSTREHDQATALLRLRAAHEWEHERWRATVRKLLAKQIVCRK